MTATADLLKANEAFAASFDKGDLEIVPAKPVLVLTCIDARLDPARMLGLDIGDAHVVRNAGGRATDDAIRSATISSWLLGTREFVVIHHTNCGMTLFTDDVLHGRIRDETGIDVSDQEYLSFTDPEESLRDDVARLRDVKTFPQDVSVSGYLYDVRDGTLREVVPAA
jgi:carbonic anhydrase